MRLNTVDQSHIILTIRSIAMEQSSEREVANLLHYHNR